MVSTVAATAQSGPAIPLYQAKQVTRTIPAMNYLIRRSVKVPMENTTLLPGASGEAIVNVRGGLTSIHVKLDGLVPGL